MPSFHVSLPSSLRVNRISPNILIKKQYDFNWYQALWILILTHCSTLIAELFKNKQQWNFPFLPWVVRTSSTWMIPNIDYHQTQLQKAKGLYTSSFYAIMWLQEFVRSLCAWRVRSGLESPEIKCITSVRERHPMSTAKPSGIVHHTFNASVLKSRVIDPTFCQHI